MASHLSDEDRALFRSMMLTPKEQGDLYRVLADVDAFMARHKLVYWACGATSLGEQRHGGLIPWGGSANLGVLKPAFAAVATYASELQRLGYGVKVNEGLVTISCGKAKPVCNIFMFCKRAGKAPVVELGVESARVQWPKARWRKTDLLPPRRVKFGPQEIFAPRKPKHHLAGLYGDDWKTVASVTLHPGGIPGRTIRIPIAEAAREAEAAALVHRIIESTERSALQSQCTESDAGHAANSDRLRALAEKIKARIEQE